MSEQRDKAPRTIRHYNDEFKISSAKLVLDQQMSIPNAAEELGIPVGTLTNWVRRQRSLRESLHLEPLKEGLPKKISKVAPSHEQQRILELEKQVRRLTLEREILKKAMAYCVDLPK